MAFLDEAGLAELWGLITEQDDEVINLVNTKSNIEYGTYVGTGTSGSSNTKSLTFSFEPKIVIITVDALTATDATVIMIRGATTYSVHDVDGYEGGSLYWSGNTVSWHCRDAMLRVPPDEVHLNKSGCTYTYAGIY